MAGQLRHLLLTTVEDPYSMNAWSGIPYSLRVALEKKVEHLSVFKPGRPKRNPPDVLKRLLYGQDKYPLWMTKAALKQNAKEVSSEIAKTKPDALLSISSQCVAYLNRPSVPAFMFSDSPWLAFQQAYEPWSGRAMRRNAYAQDEAKAARRLDGLIFGSQWACAEAQRLYFVPGESLAGKLHVVPLGANSTPAVNREEILACVDKRSADSIQLLHVGRDWERKGGEMAVEAARLLHSGGHPVRLHVVGCLPDLPASYTSPDGFVTLHGFLDRAKAEDNATLSRLFLESHFLIVPTTAECYGIVFAEAQAHALPPISRSVHALPSVVLDRETGILIDKDAPASAYVERILEVYSDRSAYRAMAIRARDRYEQALNWDATAGEIVRIISGSLASSGVQQTPASGPSA